MEDFVPSVSPISSHPPTREEEEEENEMADLVHDFGARKHKRGANFKRREFGCVGDNHLGFT